MYHYFTGPLTCQFEQQLISLAFFSCTWLSHPTSGERPSELPRGHTLIPSNTDFDSKTNQPEEQSPISSHILKAVDPLVWDKGIPWKAINSQSLRISLRPETPNTYKRQYPIKLEAKNGLQYFLDKFLRQGLLMLCQSSCNIPILSVVKPNGEYRMAQGLRAVNNVLVPIHTLVSNP